jgi:hypothetical protein
MTRNRKLCTKAWACRRDRCLWILHTVTRGGTRISRRTTGTEKEQARVERSTALSSVEHIQNSLTELKTDFLLPTELDHCALSTDTTTRLPVSPSNITKLIPYTNPTEAVERGLSLFTSVANGYQGVRGRQGCSCSHCGTI